MEGAASHLGVRAEQCVDTHRAQGQGIHAAHGRRQEALLDTLGTEALRQHRQDQSGERPPGQGRMECEEDLGEAERRRRSPRRSTLGRRSAKPRTRTEAARERGGEGSEADAPQHRRRWRRYHLAPGHGVRSLRHRERQVAAPARSGEPRTIPRYQYQEPRGGGSGHHRTPGVSGRKRGLLTRYTNMGSSRGCNVVARGGQQVGPGDRGPAITTGTRSPAGSRGALRQHMDQQTRLHHLLL